MATSQTYLKITRFNSWIRTLSNQHDPYYYNHIIYFKDQLLHLIHSTNQTKASILLRINQGQISTIYQMLSAMNTTPSSYYGDIHKTDLNALDIFNSNIRLIKASDSTDKGLIWK